MSDHKPFALTTAMSGTNVWCDYLDCAHHSVSGRDIAALGDCARCHDLAFGRTVSDRHRNENEEAKISFFIHNFFSPWRQEEVIYI